MFAGYAQTSYEFNFLREFIMLPCSLDVALEQYKRCLLTNNIDKIIIKISENVHRLKSSEWLHRPALVLVDLQWLISETFFYHLETFVSLLHVRFCLPVFVLFVKKILLRSNIEIVGQHDKCTKENEVRYFWDIRNHTSVLVDGNICDNYKIAKRLHKEWI